MVLPAFVCLALFRILFSVPFHMFRFSFHLFSGLIVDTQHPSSLQTSIDFVNFCSVVLSNSPTAERRSEVEDAKRLLQQ